MFLFSIFHRRGILIKKESMTTIFTNVLLLKVKLSTTVTTNRNIISTDLSHGINERFSFNLFILVFYVAMLLHHSSYKRSVTHNSLIRTDEGKTLETSAFNLFTVANFPYQLS